MTASYESHAPPPPPAGAVHVYANYHPMNVIMALAGGASPKGDPDWELFKACERGKVGWYLQLPDVYTPECYFDIRINDLRERGDAFTIERQEDGGYALYFHPEGLGYVPLRTDYIELRIEDPA